MADPRPDPLSLDGPPNKRAKITPLTPSGNEGET